MATEPTPKKTPPNEINHPYHYTAHPSGVECIQITEHMNFNLGNAVKYIWRAGLKSPTANTDLEKAIWYVRRELNRLANLEPVVAKEAVQNLNKTPPLVNLENIDEYDVGAIEIRIAGINAALSANPSEHYRSNLVAERDILKRELQRRADNEGPAMVPRG